MNLHRSRSNSTWFADSVSPYSTPKGSRNVSVSWSGDRRRCYLRRRRNLEERLRPHSPPDYGDFSQRLPLSARFFSTCPVSACLIGKFCESFRTVNDAPCIVSCATSTSSCWRTWRTWQPHANITPLLTSSLILHNSSFLSTWRIRTGRSHVFRREILRCSHAYFWKFHRHIIYTARWSFATCSPAHRNSFQRPFAF